MSDVADPRHEPGGGSADEDPSPAAEAGEDEPGPRRRGRTLVLEALLAVVAVALLQLFVVKPFGVPSESMEDTLHVGDRIAVNRLDHTLERGDVIVFGHGQTWAAQRLPQADSPVVRVVRWFGDLTGVGPSNTAYTVKRLIGLPGDHVSCCSDSGAVEVNGSPLAEPYLLEDYPFTPGTLDCRTAPRSSRCFPDITVPRDMLLVLGDHRSHSADSVVSCRGSTTGPECAQLVPVGRVVGPVVYRFWPLGDIGPVG